MSHVDASYASLITYHACGAVPTGCGGTAGHYEFMYDATLDLHCHLCGACGTCDRVQQCHT